MKKRIIIINYAALFLLLITINIQAGNFVLTTEIETCLSKALVTEPYSLQCSPECRDALTNYIQNNWRSVFQHWDEIATTDKRKWVLLSLCESLDANNYIEFLEAVRDLKINNKINKDMFEAAGVMPGSRKEAFLALNYQNVRVRNYLKSIRNLVSHNLLTHLDEIDSGRAATQFKEQYANDNISIGTDLLLKP